MPADIWIINGIPGAGKTTTARALAKRLPRAAHIEGDAVQDLIITGSVPPGSEPHEEEERQIHLCVQNQCLLARSFAENGFTAVIDYVVVDRNRVEEYRAHLPGFRLHLVTLDPGVEAALRRDEARPEKTVGAVWTFLHDLMHERLSGTGLWMDNRARPIEDCVDEILRRQAEAQV